MPVRAQAGFPRGPEHPQGAEPVAVPPPVLPVTCGGGDGKGRSAFRKYHFAMFFELDFLTLPFSMKLGKGIRKRNTAINLFYR